MKLKLSTTTDADQQEPRRMRSPRRALIFGAVALVGFTWALLAVIRHSPEDLRTLPVLLINTLLAFVVALGFASQTEAGLKLRSVLKCLLFALWAAALFRLIPVIGNDGMLYFSNDLTADVPYVVFFSFFRGAVMMLFIWPFAEWLLGKEKLFGLSANDEEIYQMTGATILLFFITAALVRFVVMI